MHPQLLRRLGAEIERKWDGPEWMPAKDVNQMFGWAVYSQRLATMKYIRRAEALGTEAGQRRAAAARRSWPS